MKVLVIDPKTAGISGDMLLAALIDLTGYGDLLVQLIDAINELPSCEHFSCEIQDVDAGGITAKKLAITIREKNHRHHDDMRGSAEEIAQTIGLSEIARKKAMAIINDLFCADGKLHRSKFQHHAMASVDTLFDILGSVLILDRQGFLKGEICGTPSGPRFRVYPDRRWRNCLPCPDSDGGSQSPPGPLFSVSCGYGVDHPDRGCDFC